MTQETRDRIEREAEEKYPYLDEYDVSRRSGYISGATSESKRSEELEKEIERLKKLVKELIPLAKDGYRLHIKNASHEEFLLEDREIIERANNL